VDLDPLSENFHSVAAQGGEMTHRGARTRQIGTFPVDRENIRVFAGGGAGESGFLQKAGSPAFSPSLPALRRSGERVPGLSYPSGLI